MTEENIDQGFRSKEIDKTRNYFIEEIKKNELISKKHKKKQKLFQQKVLQQKLFQQKVLQQKVRKQIFTF